MKHLFYLVLIYFCCTLPASAHLYLEKEYQRAWCSANNGKMEVVLPDKARVDCVMGDYAIEFDFAKKWGEAIGQSLYYAAVLNRKPGIVLILENGEKDNKYLERVNRVAQSHNIKIWTMTPAHVNF